jgi:hypothetical protein
MANYEQTLEKVRKGLKNPSRVLDQVILDYTYRTPAIGLNGIRTIGTNVFDREWDVLIVLDTARVRCSSGSRGRIRFYWTSG